MTAANRDELGALELGHARLRERQRSLLAVTRRERQAPSWPLIRGGVALESVLKRNSPHRQSRPSADDTARREVGD